jgi:hypothetical protein
MTLWYDAKGIANLLSRNIIKEISEIDLCVYKPKSDMKSKGILLYYCGDEEIIISREDDVGTFEEKICKIKEFGDIREKIKEKLKEEKLSEEKINNGRGEYFLNLLSIQWDKKSHRSVFGTAGRAFVDKNQVEFHPSCVMSIATRYWSDPKSRSDVMRVGKMFGREKKGVVKRMRMEFYNFLLTEWREPTFLSSAIKKVIFNFNKGGVVEELNGPDIVFNFNTRGARLFLKRGGFYKDEDGQWDYSFSQWIVQKRVFNQKKGEMGWRDWNTKLGKAIFSYMCKKQDMGDAAIVASALDLYLNYGELFASHSDESLYKGMACSYIAMPDSPSILFVSKGVKRDTTKLAWEIYNKFGQLFDIDIDDFVDTLNTLWYHYNYYVGKMDEWC